MPTKAHAAWERYVAGVLRSVEEGPAAAAAAAAAVSGTLAACRRCGSTRILVTTRQLRRADEGATEIRTCRNCGHTTRLHS